MVCVENNMYNDPIQSFPKQKELSCIASATRDLAFIFIENLLVYNAIYYTIMYCTGLVCDIAVHGDMTFATYY